MALNLDTRIMRKYRNPRYAPEVLERKLSPSQLAGDLLTVATADVVPLDTTLTLSATPTGDPGTGLPPGSTDPSGTVVGPV
jgi:hypothetical protein